MQACQLFVGDADTATKFEFIAKFGDYIDGPNIHFRRLGDRIDNGT